MRKNRIAIIMAAAMITGMSATTAFAEGPSMEGAPQMGGPRMSGPQEPGGNGQAPEMNENQAPQGEAPTEQGQQAPEMNENQAPQGEAPTGQESQDGKTKRKGNGRNRRMKGKGSKEDFGFISFEESVKDGTISQETCDAITRYMEENKPELPAEGTEKEAAEGKEGAEKEAAEGTEKGSLTEKKEGEGPDLLKELLDAGVITQDEYDALAAKREKSITGSENL